MNAVTTKTVTTQDTGETIDGATVLGDYHVNGGYDWMETYRRARLGRRPQLGQ
ncbi:hypothetical protein ABIB26_004811 [Arthrobacter sp. UYEF20]